MGYRVLDTKSKDTKQHTGTLKSGSYGNKDPLNKITLDLEKARECFSPLWVAEATEDEAMIRPSQV